MNLYHYTDQNGFLGIIENRFLWATKIQYLNDRNELNLALNIAGEVLEQQASISKDSTELFRIKRLIENLENIVDINICVCSLSEKGDLLSQWRGYSSGMGGYSIGFDKDALEICVRELGFELYKCEYDLREQRKHIESVVEETLQTFKNYDEPLTESIGYSSDSASYFNQKLANISPIIKDPSFEEEAEWRLVSKGGINFDNLNFRTGRSMLIPYYKLKLNGNLNELIPEIIVGHTPNIELATKATRALMFKHKITKSRVIPSSIPFRDW